MKLKTNCTNTQKISLPTMKNLYYQMMEDKWSTMISNLNLQQHTIKKNYRNCSSLNKNILHEDQFFSLVE